MGLTGDQVAFAMGKGGNHFISRIESGSTKLNMDIFYKLCNIYGVQPSSLFNEPQKTQKRKGFFDRMSFRGETEIPKEVKESVEDVEVMAMLWENINGTGEILKPSAAESESDDLKKQQAKEIFI